MEQFKYATVTDIVELLFNTSPVGPCTYNIFTSEKPTNDDRVNMFPFLLEIFIKGAKKLYGESINPQNMTQKQFDTLKKYMLSIGYLTKYNYTYTDEDVEKKKPIMVNIWFEPYKVIIDCHGIKRFN